MFVIITCVVILASSAFSRNVPNFKDMDEEDHILFRAAYDSYDNYNNANPSYNYETPSYSHDNEIPIGKLDLLKDGMWAVKTKLNELKTFDKALAANLLLTKMQVKELMKQLKPLKKHHHVEVDTKPVYNYQPSSYTQYEQPPHPHYSATVPTPAHGSQYTANAPQYTANAPQYSANAPQYSANAPQYSANAPQYTANSQQYTTNAPQYTANAPQYTANAPQYTSSAPQNSANAPQYTAPGTQYTAQHYGNQQPIHDPYYGH